MIACVECTLHDSDRWAEIHPQPKLKIYGKNSVVFYICLFKTMIAFADNLEYKV